MKTVHIPEIKVIPYQVNSAEINMATDRHLLAMPGTILRLYGWEHPTLSFGRINKGLGEIDLDYCRDEGIRMVNRISGGKTVFHHHELTYAFISDSELFPDSVIDTYRVISQILLNSFRRFNLDTEMSAEKKNRSDSSICFREASAFELTVNSRKLVGSAQYRKRKRFFQHGSILLDIDWPVWKRIWKLPQDSTELEGRMTSFYRELNEIPKVTDLASTIIDEFSAFFKSTAVELSLNQQAQEEINTLSNEYVWKDDHIR
ncbi:MAG: lipoate--protein ligase family protein [Deltaproteobacteria bacterium]|nr:lipoate--protein ligase family protein [Deltaproteobacteria bacterium]MBT7715886.1 lipoate--protein ligase family protein [Deltaproteobacteria bacterium]